MADFFHEGDTLRLQCSFTISGTLTDPSTISLLVRSPTATATTTYTYALAEVTKSTTGIFYKDVPFSVEGTWHWRWVGTGTVAAADEGNVMIQKGPL